MPDKLSKKVIDEVKSILPELREELLIEFKKWQPAYIACPEFYSDEQVLAMIPYAAYEYIILAWNIEPGRIDKDEAIKALNGKIFNDIYKITAHALRRIASMHLMNKLV